MPVPGSPTPDILIAWIWGRAKESGFSACSYLILKQPTCLQFRTTEVCLCLKFMNMGFQFSTCFFSEDNEPLLCRSKLVKLGSSFNDVLK